jgi:L-alanine-DL-glutamate epimerase-like enolase superfamily enzyme
MVRLSRESPLPLMLDESIDSEAELEEMLRLRCAGVVKFKLMKAGGMNELERLILRAKAAGLKVVLGNGVAGDVGNFQELIVAGRHVETAGEMNGFLKQERRLLSNPYEVSRGSVTLPAGYVPRLDWHRVQSYVVDSIQPCGIPVATKET